jgi:hypothetical protein
MVRIAMLCEMIDLANAEASIGISEEIVREITLATRETVAALN